jgi:hypothetical protein
MTDPFELQSRGWTYHDIGWTDEEDWKTLFEIVGRENHEFLACTKKLDQDSQRYLWRGQVYISPEGMIKLKRARRKLN